MKTKVNIILALFMISSCAVFAQKNDALSLLVERVLNENYGVQLVKINAEIAENNNTAGNAGMLPTVDVQGQQSVSLSSIRQELANGDQNRGDNAQSTNLNGMVALNWTVFDGFRMFAARDQLGLLADLSELESKYYIEQTVADVAGTYYALRKEHALLENLRDATTISRFRFDLEKKKMEIGASNALNFNQAKSDYYADSAMVIAQIMRIRQLEIQINTLVNDSLTKEISISDVALSFDPLADSESLLQRALQNNREYKRAMIEALISETNLKLQRSARLPEIDLFAQYNYSRQANEVGFLRSNQNIGPSVGVAVRFNLYNGGNTNRLIENARLENQAGDISTKSTAQLIESALLQAYEAYSAGLAQLNLAQSRRSAAMATMEITQKQYEIGAINGFDFRMTQINVLNASNIVDELEERIKSAQIEIYRLSGTLLSETI